MSDSKVFKFEELVSDDLMYTAGIAIERMKEYNVAKNDVVVDVIGVGAGLVDALINKGMMPISFNGGSKAKSKAEFFNFKNKRAEGYWLLREALRKCDIEIINHPELQKQLIATKYDTKEKYIQIVAKEKIKQELGGKSPDYADALMYAFYQYQSQPGIKVTNIFDDIDTYASGVKY